MLLNLESEGTRVYDILREESIRMIRTLTEWFAGRGNLSAFFLTEGMLSQAIQSVRILEAALPMPPPVAAFWHGSIFPRGRRILSIHWSGFVKKGRALGTGFHQPEGSSSEGSGLLPGGRCICPVDCSPSPRNEGVECLCRAWRLSTLKWRCSR